MKAIVETEENLRVSTPDRIQYLDSLRAIAIIMVVGVHALGYSLPLPFNQKEVISFIVHTVSVPVFFLVDGYLFAQRTILSKDRDFIQDVKKSIFRLLVPWAIFTVLYTIARYCFEISGFLNEKLIVGHSWQNVVISAYGSVYASQMYFLVSLFLIRLCGPVFRGIASVNNYIVLILLFFCYYAVYKSSLTFILPYLTIEGGQEPVLHALWGIQYYLVGIILFKTSNIINLKKLFVPFLLLFLFALPNFYKFGNVGFIIVQYLYLLTFFLLFVLIGNRGSLLDSIGRISMGIYLIHAPVILKGVSFIANKFITVPLLNFISLLFCTFLLTICTVMAIKYIPYGDLLFGTPYQRNKYGSTDKRLG